MNIVVKFIIGNPAFWFICSVTFNILLSWYWIVQMLYQPWIKNECSRVTLGFSLNIFLADLILWMLKSSLRFVTLGKDALQMLMLSLLFYKCLFASNISWKKKSSHQGKKEVAWIMSKPLGWNVESPKKLNIQEVQGALSKGRPRPATHFSGFFTFVKSHPGIYISKY